MSVVELAPSTALSVNAYDPQAQGSNALRDMIQAELAPLGTITKMTGTMTRAGGFGVIMDGVTVEVRSPVFRVPVRLHVNWKGQMTYRNQRPYKNPIHPVLKALAGHSFTAPDTSYHSAQTGHQEVTDELFARWGAHPAWAERPNPTSAQKRERRDAIGQWNTDRQAAFVDAFPSEKERGMFLEQMLTACRRSNLVNPQRFRMSKASDRLTKSSLFSPALPDFTTGQLDTKFINRKPLVQFTAEYKNYDTYEKCPPEDFFYDGQFIYSTWIRVSGKKRIDGKVLVL